MCTLYYNLLCVILALIESMPGDIFARITIVGGPVSLGETKSIISPYTERERERQRDFRV